MWLHVPREWLPRVEESGIDTDAVACDYLSHEKSSKAKGGAGEVGKIAMGVNNLERGVDSTVCEGSEISVRDCKSSRDQSEVNTNVNAKVRDSTQAGSQAVDHTCWESQLSVERSESGVSGETFENSEDQRQAEKMRGMRNHGSSSDIRLGEHDRKLRRSEGLPQDVQIMPQTVRQPEAQCQLTSSVYVLASECLTLPSDSLSMLAQYVTSSGKHTPSRSWSTSWKRNAWMRRLYTLTLPRSTVDSGVESWISSLRACRASPTALPESGRATATNEATVTVTALSRTHSESSTKLDPPWSVLKMCQLGLLPESDGFSQSGSDYAEWVTRCKTRSLSLRQALERRISGSGFSLWPSARAEDSESCGNHPGATDSLTGATRQWQTPATDSFRSRGGDRKDEMGLDQQARLTNWLTPAAQDDNKSPEAYRKMRREKLGRTGAAGETVSSLQVLVQTWATPHAGAGNKSGTKSTNGRELGREAAGWPTPRQRDHKGVGLTTERPDGRTRLDQLDTAATNFSPQAQAMNDGQPSSNDTHGSRRRLNPAFAAWLMNLPWWWTNPGQINCAQSAMARYRHAQQQHLRSLLEGLD